MRNALIIGGGIGGLSAAAALARLGIDCEVFKQSDQLREVAAAITNQPRRLGQICQWERALPSRLRNFATRSTPRRISLRLIESKIAYELPVIPRALPIPSPARSSFSG